MVNKLPYEHDNIIDNMIFKFIDTHLDIYYKLGFTPNMVTTMSLITGCYAAYLIAQNNFTAAGIMHLVSYYLDCVDGKLARKYNMVTVFGDFYDHFSDITKILFVLIALYKNDSKTFKKIILILIPLFVLSMYHIGCQQALYPEETTESPTLDIFKSTKESCMKNIYETRIFGLGTFNVVFAIIIIFWNKIS